MDKLDTDLNEDIQVQHDTVARIVEMFKNCNLNQNISQVLWHPSFQKEILWETKNVLHILKKRLTSSKKINNFFLIHHFPFSEIVDLFHTLIFHTVHLARTKFVKFWVSLNSRYHMYPSLGIYALFWYLLIDTTVTKVFI